MEFLSVYIKKTRFSNILVGTILVIIKNKAAEHASGAVQTIGMGRIF